MQRRFLNRSSSSERVTQRIARGQVDISAVLRAALLPLQGLVILLGLFLQRQFGFLANQMQTI